MKQTGDLKTLEGAPEEERGLATHNSALIARGNVDPAAGEQPVGQGDKGERLSTWTSQQTRMSQAGRGEPNFYHGGIWYSLSITHHQASSERDLRLLRGRGEKAKFWREEGSARASLQRNQSEAHGKKGTPEPPGR